MLTLEGSHKDTRHYVLDLAESGLSYECGDSLAIQPTNCPQLVEDMLTALHAKGTEEVTSPRTGETVDFRRALLEDVHITQVHTKFLKMLLKKSEKAKELEEIMKDRAALNDHLWGLEMVDLLLKYDDAHFEPQEFLESTKKLTVRLYSIASSQKAYAEEVHLTVDIVRYETYGRLRKGVCTTFLAERCDQDTEIPVFVQAGKGFRMPEDPDTPIIMVGPGTGVAPFRAFLQERREIDAKGKSWLFFGSQHEKTDFFYRQDFEDFLASGHLSKISTAFSRDQEYKVYVQHRLEENAEEFWDWLEEGAYLYVCGDASRMAKDVDAALHKIIRTVGGRSEEEAQEYVKQMKKDKRYRRDVY